MLRRNTSSIVTLCGALNEHKRFVRYTSIQDTLNPVAGQSAGQLTLTSEVAINGEAEEERRKPVFRHEVAQVKGGHSLISAMYRWGYHSLTLFKKANESSGPWWNANSGTLVSTWSQLGDYANAGMWSGVWRYTYGIGQYNLRPYEARGRAWGRKDAKSKALVVDNKDELAATPTQKFTFPHTKEHQMHQRIKNPPLPGFSEIDPLHGKRVLREIQYHLGNGLRFYLVDGVFGSHTGSATPYRIITDNPTSAYFASLAAIRKQNFVSREETLLVKRVQQNPLDEWAWRRPGVIVYHTPGFEFEAPRIVEEFGGPRPQDLSLKTPKFIALEPYSIPMKGIVSGDARCETLLDNIAFLCARWGYYADNKNFVTLKGDSVLSPDGKTATLVIGDSSDALKGSKFLLGAHHHRLDGTVLSRAWDVTSVPAAKGTAAANDIVEVAENRIQKPLSLRLGHDKAFSHRLFGRRHVSEFGYKRPHNYTDDAVTRADQGGHLFNAPRNELKAHAVRPNAISIENVNVIVVSSKASANVAEAVDAIVDQFSKSAFLYAEADKLKVTLQSVLSKAKSVKVVEAASASSELEKLAKSGSN